AAARLGSPLDPVVEIQDAHGRRQTLQEIRVGSDPVLAFRAKASGEYRLLVSNLNFHGGPQYVYRITLSTAPYVAVAFPPGAQAGTSGKVELFSLSGNGALTSRSEMVTFPAGAPSAFNFVGAAPAANSIALEATDLATVLEAEPNDAAEAATRVSW